MVENMIKKVLIISHDKVGKLMAGPGIRYHYMAKTLAKNFDVTVGFFGPENVPEIDFVKNYAAKHIDVHNFQKDFEPYDTVIAMWLSDAQIDYCNTRGKIVIFDIYAPAPVENLAIKVFSGRPITDSDEFQIMSQVHDYQKFLAAGDAFLYSNQRQLDYWIGFAFGANLVSPRTYEKRDVLKQFISAPFGIDTSVPLIKTKNHYRGIVEGIDEDDVVMVWSGGIYNWYDGITLVEAMKLVWEKNPKIKMLFPGTQHPTPSMSKWQETLDTIARAKELNLTGKNVFFFDTWIPYNDRLDFLLEANIGIYTHKPSIETEFSHRTRVVDSHIFAELPTIATEGDFFADLVERKELGVTVPAYDAVALAEAIVETSRPENLSRFHANMAKIKPSFDWSQTLAPLVEYLESSPSKVDHIMPLGEEYKPSKRTVRNALKRIIPKPVKKAALKVMPTKIKEKLL